MALDMDGTDRQTDRPVSKILNGQLFPQCNWNWKFSFVFLFLLRSTCGFPLACAVYRVPSACQKRQRWNFTVRSAIARPMHIAHIPTQIRDEEGEKKNINKCSYKNVIHYITSRCDHNNKYYISVSQYMHDIDDDDDEDDDAVRVRFIFVVFITSIRTSISCVGIIFHILVLGRIFSLSLSLSPFLWCHTICTECNSSEAAKQSSSWAVAVG